jgi:hypothetical protein
VRSFVRLGADQPAAWSPAAAARNAATSQQPPQQEQEQAAFGAAPGGAWASYSGDTPGPLQQWLQPPGSSFGREPSTGWSVSSGTPGGSRALLPLLDAQASASATSSGPPSASLPSLLASEAGGSRSIWSFEGSSCSTPLSGTRAVGGAAGVAPGLLGSEWALPPGAGGSGRQLGYSPAEAGGPAVGARQEPWLLRQQGPVEWQGQALSGASTPTHQRLPQAAQEPATSQADWPLGGGSLWGSPADTEVRARQLQLPMRQHGTPASDQLGGWHGRQAAVSSAQTQLLPSPGEPRDQPQQPLSLQGFMEGLAAEQRAKVPGLAAGAAGGQGAAEQEPGKVRASYGAFSWSW